MRILIQETPEKAQKLVDLLQAQGLTDLVTHTGRETLAQQMTGVDVLMSGYAPEEVIKAGYPTLKFIQGIYRGVDGIDLKAAKTADIRVGHTGANIISTAEYTMALMLALAKKIVPADKTLKQGKWTYGFFGSHYSLLLEGKTLAIIGLGSIGQAVAERAKAFGMRVIGVRRSGKPHPCCEVYTPDQLHKVLRQADVVVINTALTSETRNMIAANEFDVMKSSALLINTARGATIDPVALYRALKDNTIAGAAIDVWYKYPEFSEFSEQKMVYPALQPFHELDNIIMSPHRGGFVPEANQAFLEEASENVGRFVKGEQPQGLVDLDAGY